MYVHLPLKGSRGKDKRKKTYHQAIRRKKVLQRHDNKKLLKNEKFWHEGRWESRESHEKTFGPKFLSYGDIPSVWESLFYRKGLFSGNLISNCLTVWFKLHDGLIRITRWFDSDCAIVWIELRDHSLQSARPLHTNYRAIFFNESEKTGIMRDNSSRNAKRGEDGSL